MRRCLLHGRAASAELSRPHMHCLAPASHASSRRPCAKPPPATTRQLHLLTTHSLRFGITTTPSTVASIHEHHQTVPGRRPMSAVPSTAHQCLVVRHCLQLPSCVQDDTSGCHTTSAQSCHISTVLLPPVRICTQLKASTPVRSHPQVES